MNDSNNRSLITRRMEQAWAALEEAKLLREQGKSTLGVVNRAYYAMFYSVLALLQQAGKTPRKHAGALSLFDSEFVKTAQFSKRAFEMVSLCLQFTSGVRLPSDSNSGCRPSERTPEKSGSIYTGHQRSTSEYAVISRMANVLLLVQSHPEQGLGASECSRGKSWTLSGNSRENARRRRIRRWRAWFPLR